MTRGAAWAVPVVAMAVAPPAFAGSGQTPGITVTNAHGAGYLNEDSKYKAAGVDNTCPSGTKPHANEDGWIANGISITVVGANGLPAAFATVTLTLSDSANSGSFWFVSNPTAAAAEDNNLRTLALKTDAHGQLALDSGNQGYPNNTGYLRYGSGSKDNVILTFSYTDPSGPVYTAQTLIGTGSLGGGGTAGQTGHPTYGLPSSGGCA